MINFSGSILSKCIIHYVGNKTRNENVITSSKELALSENIESQLNNFMLRPFKEVTETYHFTNIVDLKLNEVFHCSDEIFEDGNFHDYSVKIVQHLYNQTRHPSIKSGEIFIAKIENILFDNAVCNAIGIFKSERKDDFFKINKVGESLNLQVDNGISLQKLDKGCLILDIDYDMGYTVLPYEYNNADTEYWRNDFLSIKGSIDKYWQTNEFLNLCKDFSDIHIKEKFGKKEQVSFLNKSLNYVKNNDRVDFGEFEVEVVEKEQRRDFETFKSEFNDRIGQHIPDVFDVAQSVVSIKKRKIKNEIKLDTSISIKLEGNNIEYPQKFIEKGFDNQRQMNFYKVFYNTEK
jgi:hypothetical protein